MKPGAIISSSVLALSPSSLMRIFCVMLLCNLINTPGKKRLKVRSCTIVTCLPNRSALVARLIPKEIEKQNMVFFIVLLAMDTSKPTLKSI